MGRIREELIFSAYFVLNFVVWWRCVFAGVFVVLGCLVVVICGEFVVDCVVNVVSGTSLFWG